MSNGHMGTIEQYQLASARKQRKLDAITRREDPAGLANARANYRAKCSGDNTPVKPVIKEEVASRNNFKDNKNTRPYIPALCPPDALPDAATLAALHCQPETFKHGHTAFEMSRFGYPPDPDQDEQAYLSWVGRIWETRKAHGGLIWFRMVRGGQKLLVIWYNGYWVVGKDGALTWFSW